MAGDSGPDATPLSLDQPVFGEHSHETLFWQAVAHLKLDPEGLVAHYLGRRSGATIAAEDGATDQELMANGGWTTPRHAGSLRGSPPQDRAGAVRAREDALREQGHTRAH